MSTAPAATKNIRKSVYLTLDDLPPILHPGHQGYHWLSIAAEAETPMSAKVAFSPLLEAPTTAPLVTWTCVFEVSNEDPDRLQAQVDDLLVRYLRAGFTMSPSLTHLSPQLCTDRNVLAFALSDEHVERAGFQAGSAPLLTEKSAEEFTIGELRVRVEKQQETSQSSSVGWRGALKSIFAPQEHS